MSYSIQDNLGLCHQLNVSHKSECGACFISIQTFSTCRVPYFTTNAGINFFLFNGVELKQTVCNLSECDRLYVSGVE